MSIHDDVVQRLVEENFNQSLIDNTFRGTYVEYLVAVALSRLDPPWRITTNWDRWDIERPADGARIEIKQTALVQTWKQRAGAKVNSFSIKVPKGYYDEQGVWQPNLQGRRYSDVYIFAAHTVEEREEADHRDLAQWEFFVLPEHQLPDQKKINLRPLRRLAGDPISFDNLAERVQEIVGDLPTLKAAQGT